MTSEAFTTPGLEAAKQILVVMPACDYCDRFKSLLEETAMDGVAWMYRRKIEVCFRHCHHAKAGALLDRGWWMLTILKEANWPPETVRTVAELVVAVGLE